MARAPPLGTGREEDPLRERLQRFVLRTQVPPFVWLYRAVYALALRLTVRWLRRIEGVRAIYLRRGLAGPDPIFGLSDIDLLVLVEDEDDRARARVGYHYDLLRQVVPMLAAGELGLYTPSQLRLLHDRVPFYRARFDRGREEWRRLWGEDLFVHLPPAAVDGRNLAVWELSPSWYYLSKELVSPDGRPGFERRYVIFKMIADACRAALIVSGGAPGMSRLEAITAGGREWPEVREALEVLRGWRAGRFTSGRIDVDSLIRAWRAVASRALAAIPGETGHPVRLRVRAPQPLGPLLSEEAVEVVVRALSGLPGIERAVLVPRLSFEQVSEVALDPSAHSGATVDAFDLLLVGSEMPPARRVRRFNRTLAPIGDTVVPYLWTGGMGFALRPTQGRPVLFARQQPEMTAWLETARTLRPGLGVAAEIEVSRVLSPPDALEERARSLLEMAASEDACCLPVSEFFALFWEAGRAACVAAGARQGRACVPATSSQVLADLSELAPGEAGELETVHREYLLELEGDPSEAVRYVGWSRAFVRRLGEQLFSPGGPRSELPSPPRSELGMSVVIVTRNRSANLRKALESLTRQERPPDQVVVVDNASSDDTAQVALSYADRLELRLVREERVGIPLARNAGLDAATGDLVASMDDDCIADPGWLAELERPFLKDPHLGAAGGSVLPQPGQSGAVASFYRYHQELRAPHAKGAGL